MFELATKNKFRFPYKGQISVEDLWDLKVEELDVIFKTLNAQVRLAKEESLLSVKTTEEKTLEAKINIIKHIVNVKQEEAALAKQRVENKQKREQILSLIADKQNEAMKGMSIEQYYLHIVSKPYVVLAQSNTKERRKM